MAKKSVVSVIERRLTSGNVFRTSSQPIPLKDPKAWTLRWENSEISPDHMNDIIREKGWIYCEPDDLDCPVEQIGATTTDGRIVRGPKGAEVLMKMPLRAYKQLEKLKTKANIEQTFGKKQMKDAIVAGVAAEHGDEAAEFVSRNVNAININDARGPEDAL